MYDWRVVCGIRLPALRVRASCVPAAAARVPKASFLDMLKAAAVGPGPDADGASASVATDTESIVSHGSRVIVRAGRSGSISSDGGSATRTTVARYAAASDGFRF